MSTEANVALRRSSARSSRKERKRRTRARRSVVENGKRETPAGNRGGRTQPGAPTHLARLQQEGAQADAGKHLADALLQEHPDRTNSAIARLPTALRLPRQPQPMH